MNPILQESPVLTNLTVDRKPFTKFAIDLFNTLEDNKINFVYLFETNGHQALPVEIIRIM